MLTVENRVRATVLSMIAFGFLGFYIWFSFKGVSLLDLCRNDAGISGLDLTPPSVCQARGDEMRSAMDLFLPVSGVVSAVAMTALGFKPEALTIIASALRKRFRALSANDLLDALIVLYLLAWVGIGLMICFKTASLSAEQASLWKLDWLRSFGRTWWPSALTAVALWMGVPIKKG